MAKKKEVTGTTRINIKLENKFHDMITDYQKICRDHNEKIPTISECVNLFFSELKRIRDKNIKAHV